MVPLLDRSDLNKPPEYTIWFQEVVSNNFFFSNRRRRCRRWPAVASRARPINRAARRLFWAFATTAAATGWSTARRGSTGPDRTATATTSRPTTTKTTTEKTRLANFSYFSHIRSPHPHDKGDQAFLGHDLVWIAKNHSCSASSIQSCRFRGREAFFFWGGGGSIHKRRADSNQVNHVATQKRPRQWTRRVICCVKRSRATGLVKGSGQEHLCTYKTSETICVFVANKIDVLFVVGEWFVF